MEFKGLKAQYKALKDKIDLAMIRTALEGNFIMGKQVSELEDSLAEYVGVKHCITCANGTDALTMSLMYFGVKKGDAVFVPDFTFFSSAEVVSFLGATPVFVDVDQYTFNIDPKKLKEAITMVKKQGKYNPKAIIAVDLFGLCADYYRIKQIAKEYDLLLLEDGAQGFGSTIKGDAACCFGDIATTSFFPAKPLGCYGDGGAVFTNDDAADEYLRSVRIHGKGSHKYDNVRIGINSRLDTIQAAILQVKFQALKEYELDALAEAAAAYTESLRNVVAIPTIPRDYRSSWAQYTIALKNEQQRNNLQIFLKSKGIPTMIYYPKALHMQGAFKYLEYSSGDYPITEKLCKCVLSLPIHPYITKKELLKVTDMITTYINRR
ncbi:DegT/DnrJ/EryC1/StrS family aminotransferase [Clostridium oryzae]|uniref:UDP-2-acetamido-2-deoxy-3-oxo-D-glucuronate aminotransferase n=1 Tax=Clostridium oryzae TaxID=1450648 RepID=A0A1V4IZ87_9CLOT|nr:DegT/DnrJ/EryC1/StrS family aminotransferase [Clostridium oryzae]OPJ65094.1 UDP-2-acetamido-2-deoxy-3-oxo-D-glucuronate aminotransferase [Clostridium oryzae]